MIHVARALPKARNLLICESFLSPRVGRDLRLSCGYPSRCLSRRVVVHGCSVDLPRTREPSLGTGPCGADQTNGALGRTPGFSASALHTAVTLQPISDASSRRDSASS